MTHLDTKSENQLDVFLRDVLDGLNQDPKLLPCKYFYDANGSRLFDQICELDEYYLTRTEFGIIKENIESIACQIGKRVMLVEFGSGSSTKTRILLDALDEPVAYVPVDISEKHLLKTAAELRVAYPNMEILPVVGDFTCPFTLPDSKTPSSHVALYFPGSTIGNFTEEQAGELMGLMSNLLGPEGGMLIGIDLQKDRRIIEAAYDDASGVTARFNLNLLLRINFELDADFDLENFQHRAVYDELRNRVEISIVSLVDQRVTVEGQVFEFKENEQIHTEYSHKYTIDGFAQFASQYGFGLHNCWTDENQLFAVLHLVLE